MHFFLLPRLSIQVQHCLFAYSPADSVKNNLGIVTGVIRKMIKQAFLRRTSLSQPPVLFGGTVAPLPNFYLRVELLLQRLTANSSAECMR